ncbi:MAG: radical SAM protein [Nitrospirae bacterium CG_4_9_14_3_um_filter_41_27]|nr:MAG: radical SAM protein [Nitrospirae bacterium CG11_big_fil_rev_8_21_14_0_20_41_14]PJA80375.1 MAG: radical SAM protein [Nitrospirae bacterium CG_4_9_14_3_um_filter_41_27]
MQTIERKSLLYKSEVEYGDYCINHVEGCSHGCKYPCYAYMMKKRCGIVKTYEEWCRPKIVSNALELLDKEIPKYKKKIKYVHLCFSTDPFMYEQEEVCDLSFKIIDKLNKNNIRCTVLTKGVFPSELGNRNGFSNENEYGITLVSLSEKFRKEFEPNSANFKNRIESLKYLHKKGFKTWVSMEPYPTPNLIKQDLMEILKAVSFVNKIVFGRLNYNVKSSEFKYNKEFYNSLALSVIKFCRRNKISYHIKQGTQI